MSTGTLASLVMAGKDRVVLAENEGAAQPFVTHVVDEEGNRFWGHYFFDLQEARADFIERVEHELSSFDFRPKEKQQ